MNGELTFDMDDREGFIRVRGTGMWTCDQAAVHFVALHRAVSGLRAVRQKVLVLVDLSEAQVQPADVAQAVSNGTGRIYRKADFVGLVADKTLLAMQMKHAAKVPNLAVFKTVDEATAWLREQRG